jgi:hypothetical protein
MCVSLEYVGKALDEQKGEIIRLLQDNMRADRRRTT